MPKLNVVSYLNFVKTLPAPIILTDCDGHVEYVNKAFTRLTGYTFDEIKNKKIGKTSKILYSGFHPDEFYKKMWGSLKADKKFEGQIKNKKKNGKIYWQHLTIKVVDLLDEDGHFKSFCIASVHDITKVRHNSLMLKAIIDDLGEDRIITIFKKDKTLLEVLGESRDPVHRALVNNVGKKLDKLPIYNSEFLKKINVLFNKVDENPKKQYIKHHCYEENGESKDLKIIAKRFNSSKYLLVIVNVTDFSNYLKIKMGLNTLKKQVSRLIDSRFTGTENETT